MKHSKPTQARRILDYMNDHGSITQYEALQELGVMRLASRISELRKCGYKITSETAKVKNRWDEICRVKRYKIQREDVDSSNGN